MRALVHLVVSAAANALSRNKTFHVKGAALHDVAANMAYRFAERADRRHDESAQQRWIRTAGRQRSRAYQARINPLPPE